MGKQFSSPTIEGIDTAVAAANTAVAAVNDALTALAGQVNTLKNTDVSNISTKVGTIDTKVGTVDTHVVDAWNDLYVVKSLMAESKPGVVTVTNTAYTNTILDIAGSGVLDSIGVESSTQQGWSVQIDGGSIFTMTLCYGGHPMNLRFFSHLTVKSGAANGSGNFAVYKLD